MKKILLFSLASLLYVGVANAQYGLEETANTAGLSSNISGASTPAEVIGDIVAAGLSMVGVLFLLLMIYGGVMWMIARGNEQQTDKALNTIKAAVIGLIIVMASYAITAFVFNAISGNNTSTSSANACVQGEACVDNNDCGTDGICITPVPAEVCEDAGALDGTACTSDADCGTGTCVLQSSSCVCLE